MKSQLLRHSWIKMGILKLALTPTRFSLFERLKSTPSSKLESIALFWQVGSVPLNQIRASTVPFDSRKYLQRHQKMQTCCCRSTVKHGPWIHRVASSGFWAGIPTRGSLGDIYRTRFDPAEHSNVRTGFDPTLMMHVGGSRPFLSER